jgi:hypothetical protein
MTLPIFPTLVGLSEVIKRTPKWSTTRQESVSGRRTDLALWSYPRWDYELTYNFLRADVTHLEFQTLAGFYNIIKSGPGLFQFNDIQDNLVINQVFGSGNGSNTSYQLVRTMGGFTEPVFAMTSISVSRSDLLGSTLAYPTPRTNYVRNSRVEGAVAGTPGTLPTYWSIGLAAGLAQQIVGTGITSGIQYVDIRVYGTPTNTGLACNLYLDTNNATTTLNQTWASSAWVQLIAGTLPGNIVMDIGEYATGTAHYPGTNIAAPSIWARNTNITTVTDPAINQVDAMIWVYLPTIQAVDFTIRIGGPQLEVGSMATSLILPPVGSPAVTTVTDYSVSSLGLVTFANAPAAAAILTWTGNYNWLVRFADDNVDFSSFASQFWSTGSIKLTSEKL